MNAEERIRDVLEKLAAGKTRDQIAEDYGVDRASLDQLFRRRAFRWDKHRNTYVCAGAGGISQRAQRILLEFESVTADAKQIATLMGFADHKAMAEFMRQQGFEWSSDIRNYVVKRETPKSDEPDDHDPVGISGIIEPTINWGEYLPLLQFLHENRGRLYMLVDQTPDKSLSIPRFGVGGGHTIKSIQLAAELEKLVRDFSNEKSISQREIFEVALIQFFYRYGYGKRVEQNLISE